MLTSLLAAITPHLTRILLGTYARVCTSTRHFSLMKRMRLSALETWSPAATVSTSMLWLANMLVMLAEATAGSLSILRVVMVNPLALLADITLSRALRTFGILLLSMATVNENSSGVSKHMRNISFLTNMRSTSAICSMTTSVLRGSASCSLVVVVLVVRPRIAARLGP